MMINKEDFDFFIEQMHQNAINDYAKTDQYKLLREKLDCMDNDCENMLDSCQQGFVTEYLELLSDSHGQQELYVYRKCFLDCVNLLKWLNII